MITRRSLITQLALAAVPAGLARAAAPVSNEETKHTLIHIFLRGGADTLNLLVPYADDRYYRLRPSLAVAAKDTLRLTDQYALHPALAPLEVMYKEGRFGAVQSVGVDNTSGSHFDCQDQMEHGDSMHSTPAGGGWLGRFLRQREDSSALAAVAMGTVLPESLRGAPAVSVLERIEDIAIKAGGGGGKKGAAKNKADDASPVVKALEAMYGTEVTLLGQRGQETLQLFKKVASLQGQGTAPENGALYPKDPFGTSLREVARLVKARVGLRVACVDLGGWDTHFLQGNATGNQAGRIRLLADGLAALDADLKDHRSRFTVMITTEFGRRVYENASLGTDHGRGFALMALGDRVKGGQILGQWPIQAEEDLSVNLVGPGGLHAETDYRAVFAEVLRGCFGASVDVHRVFPGAELKTVGLM